MRGASFGGSALSLFFGFGLEGLGDHLAAGLFQQDFHARFGLLELLLAIARKLHAFLEKLHGLVERQIGALELAHDLFQPRQRLLEIRLLGRLGFFPGGGVQRWLLCRSRSILMHGAEATQPAAGNALPQPPGVVLAKRLDFVRSSSTNVLLCEKREEMR